MKDLETWRDVDSLRSHAKDLVLNFQAFLHIIEDQTMVSVVKETPPRSTTSATKSAREYAIYG